MIKAIGLEDLADEIERITREYSKEVVEELEKVTHDTGKKLVTYVREKAPVDTGKYRNAITVSNKTSIVGAPSSIVHVKAPHYRLAHLLERAHSKRGGGLSKPQPHWGPARKKIEPEYIYAIKKKIGEIK